MLWRDLTSARTTNEDGCGHSRYLQGIDIIMKNDVLSGIEFVMNMIVICLSITVGLLLSKVLLHDGFLGVSRVIHRRNQNSLYEEEESLAGNEREEDQQMAI